MSNISFFYLNEISNDIDILSLVKEVLSYPDNKYCIIMKFNTRIYFKLEYNGIFILDKEP